MSTRSITHVSENGFVLLSFYRHSDGYPQGHGKDLAKFLNGFSLTNGVHCEKKTANGAGCLAAQIIAHFKDGPGEIYIEQAGAKGMGEDYVYNVRVTMDRVTLSCHTVDANGEQGERVFDGSPSACLSKIKGL